MSYTRKNSDQQCPRCGEANSCALSVGKTIDECWCKTVVISDSTLNDISEPEKYQRCLCPACVRHVPEKQES